LITNYLKKMEIKLTPVATVKNTRLIPIDDFWKEITSEIELAEHIPTEAFDHISDFSKLFFYSIKPHKTISCFQRIREEIIIILRLVFLHNEKKIDQIISDFVQLNY